MQVVTYLSFPGTCEEAFTLYADCLGGKVGEIFRYTGTDLAKQVPADFGQKVMHGSVTFGNQVFMGADAAPAQYKPPHGFSLSVHLSNPADAKRIFGRLAEGGKVTMPLEKTFWAALFGQLVDRFGIEWAINCDEPTSLVVSAICAWLTSHGTSCLETVAVAFGIVSVYLSTRQKIASWPTAIVNVSLYFALFLKSGLYSDTGLQVVYFGLSVYGWYEWLYGGANRTALTVSRATPRTWGRLGAIALVVYVILGQITSRLPGTALPWVDAGTSTVSLVAQYMMTRKLLENWALWVCVDVVYIMMFIYKGLYLTAFNYAVYLGISAAGWFAWRRSLIRTPIVPPSR